MSAASILVLHASDEPYGADRILLALLSGLHQRGHRLTVLLPVDVPEGWLSGELRAAGIEIHRVDLAVARRRYLGPRGIAAWLVALVRVRRTVRSWAGVVDAGLIYVNTSALLVGALVGHPNGARRLWQVHEIVIRPRLLAWVFRLAPVLSGDRVIAVSDAVRRHITPFGIGARRVVTVHNGLPPREPAPLLDLRAGEGEGPLVAFVGRLNRWKGAEVFVDAVTAIAGAYPDARFVVAGDAPPGELEREDELRARIAAAGLTQRVQMLGRVADGASVFDAADIAVVPSTWPDPFPTVVLEAMRAGCAVVASNHGGAPEMIVSGVHGFLVPPGDAAALGGAIGRLLDDPGLRSRLGSAARERVSREFGLDRMLAEAVAVVDGLVG